MTPGPSASRPVGVGIIGAGHALPAYLQALDRLTPRGLAREGPICARRPEAARRLLARRPAARVVERPGDVLTDDDTDLVVVLTPPATHAALVGEALRAGKHVLCEKPLARDPMQATELFAAADASGLMLVAAPFVYLSPTFRRLWTLVTDGVIGHVHAARAHYGNPGSTWAAWYHAEPLATLGDVGIYNISSLAALLGPVIEVLAASAHARPRRLIAGAATRAADPDTWQVMLRHEDGALSSVLASQATVRYRRSALELYGTEGTAQLLGDDWDPHGIEVWREDAGTWTVREPDDATWLWTDGLRDAVLALRDGRAPIAHPPLVVHVLEVIAAAGRSASDGSRVAVTSRPDPFEALRVHESGARVHIHDPTRPADEQ